MDRLSSLARGTALALSVAACAACAAEHPVPAVSSLTRHGTAAIPVADSPLWVADQYFVASGFPDERAHVTGELAARFAAQPTLGSLLDASATVALRPVLQEGDSAVVAATVVDSAGRRATEWYAYLLRDAGAWKMYAVRTVRFSPAYYARLDSLTTHARPSAAGPATRMLAAAGSDRMLRAFVVAHQPALDSLVAAYRAIPTAPALLDVADARAGAGPSDPAPSDPEALVHRLLTVSSVSSIFRNPANPACTFVRIDGEGRRQAGAFRADSGCHVPAMSPAGLVYAEHVVGPWYVYRAL